MEKFNSFSELAKWAGVKVIKQGKVKKIKNLPESTFEFIKTKAGRAAACVYLALIQRSESKRSGIEGDHFMTIGEIVDMTGYHEQDVIDGVLRLAETKMLTKITPEFKIAA